MSPALQAKLLHTVENGVVRPVGTDREVKVDVRILAATHRDLRERALAGAFRQDLLYRLDVVTVEIPALRHRRDDIPVLVERLLLEAKTKHPQSPVSDLAGDALAKLLDYSPGRGTSASSRTRSSVSSFWAEARSLMRAICLRASRKPGRSRCLAPSR